MLPRTWSSSPARPCVTSGSRRALRGPALFGGCDLVTGEGAGAPRERGSPSDASIRSMICAPWRSRAAAAEISSPSTFFWMSSRTRWRTSSLYALGPELVGRDLFDELHRQLQLGFLHLGLRRLALRCANGPRRRSGAAASPARRPPGAASRGTACRAPRSGRAPPAPSAASPWRAADTPCRRPCRDRGSTAGRSRSGRSVSSGTNSVISIVCVASSSSAFSSSGVKVT